MYELWGGWTGLEMFNTLRPRQNGRYFADDILKCIFLNENVRIPIEISLKFVPKGPIDNIPALVQIMAWRRPGDKPLSEAMMVNLPTHICVSRPQWVNDDTGPSWHTCCLEGMTICNYIHCVCSVYMFNSLWPIDAIWWHRYGLTFGSG